MRNKRIAKIPVTTVVVLVLGLVLSVIAARSVYVNEREKAQQALDQQLRSYTDVMRDELNRYEVLLVATKGLFESSNEVTRSEFSNFVRESTAVATRFEALSSVAFVDYAATQEEADVIIDSIRKEGSFEGLSFENVLLQPEGTQPPVYIAKYREPLADGIDFIGFNTGSLPGRAATYERSFESEQVTAFDNVELLSGAIGFTMVDAVENNGELAGVLLGAVQTERFLNLLYGNQTFEGVQFVVQSPSLNRALFTAGDGSSTSGQLESHLEYQFDQMVLQLSLTKPFPFNAVVYQAILIGLVFTGLFVVASVYVERSRNRALSNEAVARQEVSNQEQFFGALIHNVAGGVLVYDATGAVMSVNHEFVKDICESTSLSSDAPPENCRTIDEVIRRLSEKLTLPGNNDLSRIVRSSTKHDSILVEHSSGRHYEFDSIPIIAGKQRLGGYLYFRDVSDYQQRQSAMKQKEQGLEEINKAFIGREMRIRELKERVRELEKSSNEKSSSTD